MAIKPELLSFKSVGDLFAPTSPPLRIPDFQRPYSWTPQNVRQLVTDVENALKTRPELPYVMGTIILLGRPGYDHFEIVDGQQRLLTLHMLRTLLHGDRLTELDGGQAPIHHVYQELVRLVRDLSDAGEYGRFLDTHAQVLQIVTDDEDEAFQFFDSQNFRGKALRPHDLLKAFHLREMTASTAAEKRAVVEEWEVAEENDLDRLFGTYLARIHWWSRNLPARAFTADDVDIFKGVGRSTPRLPGTDYHRAAKAMLPGVQEWARVDADERSVRDQQRSRHQLEAPIVAGRSFFDFAAFMLAESSRLEIALFRHDADMDAESPDEDLEVFKNASRFHFNRELCVAAALYYVNKYSEVDFTQVRRHLFRWAYGLRLAYQRMGWPSTDNYARGGRQRRRGLAEINLFAAMRDSLDPGALALEQIPVPDEVSSKHEDDKRLYELLQEGC